MQKVAIVMLLAVLFNALVRADPGEVQVFGVSIGKPIDVPECPLGRGGVKYGEFREITQFCWADTFGKGSGVFPKNGSVKLKIPGAEWPGFVSWGELRAWVVDGAIEGVNFGVHHTKYEMALAQFIKKFGEPQSKDNSPVTNRMGAVFDNSVARWMVGSIRISLEKRSDDVEMGSAQIMSPKADDYLKQRHSTPREGSRSL